MGLLYGVSAPPLDRFFSLSTLVGLAWSDDDSCNWTSSGGSLDTFLATDYFADPTNPRRVYAIGVNPTDQTVLPQVFASDDGGQTFGAAIFIAKAGYTLSGLENARSDPRTLYVATYLTTSMPPMLAVFHPRLQRSTDGGASWTELDLEASLGQNNFRIVAVDPSNASVLTVRVIEPGESLTVSRDGGMSFTKVAHLAGQFTAYVRLDSGTILVAGALAIDGVGFRSTHGMTFTDWTPQTLGDGGVLEKAEEGGAARPPHLRALATRGGKLYAAAKNFTDDWAVGVSTDEGVTFTKLARYDQVSAIRPCVKLLCMDACDYQAAAFVWSPSTCSGAGGTTMPPLGTSTKGCGCALGHEAGDDASGLTVLRTVIVLGAALGLGRARRRGR